MINNSMNKFMMLNGNLINEFRSHLGFWELFASKWLQINCHKWPCSSSLEVVNFACNFFLIHSVEVMQLRDSIFKNVQI